MTAYAAEDDFTASVQVGEDEQVPTVPQNVVATAIASDQIHISWDASTDNFAIAGYRVLRDTLFLATTTATSYSDTGLLPSTSYGYVVQAFDASGNTSTSSATTTATTLAEVVEPPEPPVEEGGGEARTSTGFYEDQAGDIVVSYTSFEDRIVFTLNGASPFYYNVSWQPVGGGKEGRLQELTQRQRHTALLEPLESDTAYQFEFVLYRRNGASLGTATGIVSTLSEGERATPENVTSLQLERRGETGVVLVWDGALRAGEEVRVVRSPYGYPRHPFAGYVVYEGVRQEITDREAFVDEQTAYYTVFVRGAEGMYSSGVVGRISVGSTTEQPSVTDGDQPITLERSPTMTISQAGAVTVTATSSLAVIEGGQSSVVTVQGLPYVQPYGVYAMLQVASEQSITQYLLRRQVDGTYEAVLPALVQGNYTFSILLTTTDQDVASATSYNVQVALPEGRALREDEFVLQVVSLFGASILLLLFGLLVYLRRSA